MSEQVFQFVRHEEVPAYEAKGWVRLPALDDTPHGQWSSLMQAPRESSDRLVYLRGNPAEGVAELVVAPGDHTCVVYPLTLTQVRRLSAQAADFAWKWKDEVL